MTPGPPRAADELFALPLSEFTRRRNELAKQLKSAGDKDGSARVAALPKPSLAAWALNQVARWNPKLVAELLQVDEILRSPGSSSTFRKASSDRNRIVREIVEAASGMLEKNGHSAGAGVAAKLTQTLLSVGTDDEARRALIEGRLLKEVESGSFGDEAWALNVPSVEPDTATGDARDREQEAGAPGEAQEKAEATTGADSTSMERSEAEAEAERRNELRAEIERLEGIADEKARAVRQAAERAKKARAEAEIAETARVAAEREAAEAAEAVGRKKAEMAELAP